MAVIGHKLCSGCFMASR